MSLGNKIKEAFATKSADLIATGLSVLLLWGAYQLTPIVLPAIEAAAPRRALLALLATSVALNVVAIVVLWVTRKEPKKRARFGVLWDKDKNPYCPTCDVLLGKYANWQFHGHAYRCPKCSKLLPLSDDHENDITPTQARERL